MIAGPGTDINDGSDEGADVDVDAANDVDHD